MATVMSANYPGFCLSCAKPFVIGTSIAIVGGGITLHAECPSASPERLKIYGEVVARRNARSEAHALGIRTTNPNTRGYKKFYVLCAEVACHGGAANASKMTGTASEITVEAKSTSEEEIQARMRAAIAKAVADALAAAPQSRAELLVKIGDSKGVVVKTPHKNFDVLLKMVVAGVNVWVAGPAGSGKTTGAQMVAEAMGLPFFFNGALDSEYKLSGFVDAQGKIVSTAFRKAYSEGGVYLFDECDASLPSATLAFNAALANGHCDFPGSEAPVSRHPDFRCIAAGNTWGHGATVEYVGRNRMDAAFLDRFVQLSWEYDETLELALVGESPEAKSWCRRVQKLRATAKQRGLKIVISPRASLAGAKLLAAGLTEEEVVSATIRAKIAPADWANLNA